VAWAFRAVIRRGGVERVSMNVASPGVARERGAVVQVPQRVELNESTSIECVRVPSLTRPAFASASF